MHYTVTVQYYWHMTCTPLNITVHTPWLSLYRTEENGTGELKYTVQKWPLYLGTDLHCKILNSIVWGYWNTLYKAEQHCTGALIYTLQKLNNNAREHWSTLYKNWKIIHGSIDLHFTKTEQWYTGALIYTLQKRTTLSGGLIYTVHDETLR